MKTETVELKEYPQFKEGDVITWKENLQGLDPVEQRLKEAFQKNLFGPGPFLIAKIGPVPSMLEVARSHDQWLEITTLEGQPVRAEDEGVTSLSGMWFEKMTVQ